MGLPNVGKSTFFNALTKNAVPAANYPFCTIDPAVGIVAVPDERLEILAKFTGSKKIIPAAIEFVDIAGLVEGAASGQGLGNQFLSHIRETDAILEMVRIFPITGSGDDITHVYGTVDPLRDIGVINMELMLADLQTVDKRLANIGRDAKRGDKDAVLEFGLLERLKTALEAGRMANTVIPTDEEVKAYKQLNLLTTKKFIYGLNKRSGVDNLDKTDAVKFSELTKAIEAMGSQWVVIDAKLEDELKEFEGAEKDAFRETYGEHEDGVRDLIKACYKLLDLETYLTTGPEETRAWTIAKNSTAPVAAAAIHTDFQNKFIRAEVVFWQDLIDAGSYGEARARGKVRIEGKEYIVKDGDVIEFRI